MYVTMSRVEGIVEIESSGSFRVVKSATTIRERVAHDRGEEGNRKEGKRRKFYAVHEGIRRDIQLR